MKTENPFRNWLDRNVYGGTWVPVADLGGWLGPASLPVLFPSGKKDTLLAGTEWPFQIMDARPEVWESREGKPEAHLHPEHHAGEVPLQALAAYFNPPGRPSWVEPIQAFVLFHEAAPRHQPGGRISWEKPDEDGLPDEIARWRRIDENVGVLEIRRDMLFSFMSDFDFDLAVFFEENRGTDAVPDGWRDEEQEDWRTWRTWATEVLPDDVRVVLRCVTVIPRPEPLARAEDGPIGQTLEYPIGTDPGTGTPVLVSYPGPPNDRTAWPGAGNDNFLTPVYFKRQVLDYYLNDPRYYTVTPTRVEAGGMWGIDIAITERDHVQVWLGDLGRISENAQRHWQQYGIADDDDVPDWRLGRDLRAELTEPRMDEGVERVRTGIDRCNSAAQRYCGVALLSSVGGMNEQRIQTLHRPLNNSQPEFQQQVTSLAILLVDHLNLDFLKAVGAPKGPSPLNRLASWIEGAFDLSQVEAKDVIGGLYAVYAVRSEAGGAHRAGSRASEVLERAEVDLDDLPAGFEALANRAADSLEELEARLNDLTPITGSA